MKSNDSMTKYTQMGMAALLPGMQYMVEQMQAQLDEFRVQLAVFQNGGPKAQASETRASRVSGYWAKMTEEERSAEVIRRRSVRSRNKAIATRKATWAKKTEAEKEAWKLAVQAGKKRNKRKDKKEPAPAPPKKATVRLAVAS